MPTVSRDTGPGRLHQPCEIQAHVRPEASNFPSGIGALRIVLGQISLPFSCIIVFVSTMHCRVRLEASKCRRKRHIRWLFGTFDSLLFVRLFGPGSEVQLRVAGPTALMRFSQNPPTPSRAQVPSLHSLPAKLVAWADPVTCMVTARPGSVYGLHVSRKDAVYRAPLAAVRHRHLITNGWRRMGGTVRGMWCRR